MAEHDRDARPTADAPPPPPAPRRSLERAAFLWGAAFVGAVAVLLVASAPGDVRRGLADTVASFLAWKVLVVVLLAFVCEWVDSSLGMGYGTTLTPGLLLLGYAPLQIVPAVLLSELLTGLTGGMLHHGAGNVDFSRGSPHRRIMGVLAACSALGTGVAALVAVSVSRAVLEWYIGILVLAIGAALLLTVRRSFAFSWHKIVGLGLLAAFNKGMSGGGYGPVVTGGQVLSGLDARPAVGITTMSEGITCLVGVLLFGALTGIDATLALPLSIGAMASVPAAVVSVRAMPAGGLRLAVAVATTLLGLATVVRILAR